MNYKYVRENQMHLIRDTGTHYVMHYFANNAVTSTDSSKFLISYCDSFCLRFKL